MGSGVKGQRVWGRWKSLAREYKAMRQDEIRMSVIGKNQGPRIEPGGTPIITDEGEEEEIEQEIEM